MIRKICKTICKWPFRDRRAAVPAGIRTKVIRPRKRYEVLCDTDLLS
jgi:hypothetical protein